MRPTFSIILFTVLSGAGYGLWFLIGIGLALRWPACAAGPPAGSGGPVLVMCSWAGVVSAGLVTGFILVSAGLVSSLGHLGKPRRAWRALSQWRSSWLSREGIAALLTYVPAAAILADALARTSTRALVVWPNDSATRVAGALLALGALATVFCTAHIYSSLKPIRAWHNRHVVAGYLLLGLYAGALCLWVLASVSPPPHAKEPGILPISLIVLGAAAALLKHRYWRDIDREPAARAGHATGLDALGVARSFEQPHTEQNYLTHEMGFVLARAHARKLRTLAWVAGFLVPAVLATSGLALPALRGGAAWLALISGMTGILVERWLFFAEARHTVIAYYAR